MSIYLQNYLFNLSNLFGSVFPQGFQLREGQDVTTPDHQHQQGDRILLLHFLSEKENENEGPDYRARTGHDAWSKYHDDMTAWSGVTIMMIRKHEAE